MGSVWKFAPASRLGRLPTGVPRGALTLCGSRHYLSELLGFKQLISSAGFKQLILSAPNGQAACYVAGGGAGNPLPVQSPSHSLAEGGCCRDNCESLIRRDESEKLHRSQLL